MINQENEGRLDLSEKSEASVITLESLFEEGTAEVKIDEKKEEIVSDTVKKEENKNEEIELEGLKGKPDDNKGDEPVIVPQNNSSSFTYKDFVNRMVESGEWSPLESIETETGEVPFEEVEITEEIFNEIVKHQDGLKRESLLLNKVDAEGISDFTKKLIEIEKQGGDVRQALDSYTRVKEPLTQIDITTEQGQSAAIYLELTTKGLSDEEVDTIIEGYKTKGVLEDKGIAAKEKLEEAFNKHIESIEQAALKERAANEEALKTYRKELKEGMAKKFELNETTLKKLTDAASKLNPDGKFELDVLYNKVRKDPKEAADLVYFLLDKENYLKEVSKESTKAEKVKMFTKLNFAGKSGSSLNMRTQSNNKDDGIALADLK